MSRFIIFHGEDDDGADRYWFEHGDGKRSEIFTSFQELIGELVPAFNFQRSHNASARILYGQDDGIVFLAQPDGGLFQLRMVPGHQGDMLWAALTAPDDEEK